MHQVTSSFSQGEYCISCCIVLQCITAWPVHSRCVLSEDSSATKLIVLTSILHASFGVCLIALSQLPVQASPCIISCHNAHDTVVMTRCISVSAAPLARTTLLQQHGSSFALKLHLSLVTSQISLTPLMVMSVLPTAILLLHATY